MFESSASCRSLRACECLESSVSGSKQVAGCASTLPMARVYVPKGSVQFLYGAFQRAQAIHIHRVDPHPVIGATGGLGSRAIRGNVDHFRALLYSYCITNAGGHLMHT